MSTNHTSGGRVRIEEPPDAPLQEGGSDQAHPERVGPVRLVLLRLATLGRNLMYRRPGPDEPNARYLYIEMFWAQVQVALTQFNAPFALRLGASNAEIGFLSSIPSLIALVVTIPAGRMFSRQTRRREWLTGSIFLYRLGFLLAACVPLLALGKAGTVLVWLLILFTAPAHIFNAGWLPTQGDAVTERNRARVFSVRNTLAHVGLTASLIVAGIWLEKTPFPINYQVLYVVGFATSLVSTVFIGKVRVAPAVATARSRQSVSVRALWQSARETASNAPDFVRITCNTFYHAVGLWMVGPVYILYFVRQLGATEGWIGLNIMLANLAPIVGYMVGQRVLARWGENRTLRLTMNLIGFYPLLVGLTPNLSVILVWTTLNGLIAASVHLSHFNMLLKVSPEAERATYLAVYSTAMNAGAFIMPLVGVYLAEHFGFAPVLIAGGVLSLIGSSSFSFNRLQTADTLALYQETISSPRTGEIS